MIHNEFIVILAKNKCKKKIKIFILLYSYSHLCSCFKLCVEQNMMRFRPGNADAERSFILGFINAGKHFSCIVGTHMCGQVTSEMFNLNKLPALRLGVNILLFSARHIHIQSPEKTVHICTNAATVSDLHFVYAISTYCSVQSNHTSAFFRLPRYGKYSN